MKVEATNPKAIRAGQEFPQRLKEIHGDCIVLRDTAVYREAHKPIDVQCTVCGWKWSPEANDLKKGHGCPNCYYQSHRDSVGKRRCRRVTACEKEFAKRCEEAGMPRTHIAKMLHRSPQTIAYWLSPEHREKQKKKSLEHHAQNKASGRKAETARIWANTDHGRKSIAKNVEARRALDYQCNGLECIDGVWYEDDLWSYVKDDKEGQELMSFPDAHKAYAFRKKQCEAFERWSGEPYERDHIIPLSRGGVHHPLNFQNLPKVINRDKSNTIRECDIALFCKRIFNIK